MKRGLLLIFMLSLFFISCSGIFWEGSDGDELTIAIDNPFYQPTASALPSRALALQGKYLYIELALIEDKAAYDSDSEKLMFGNGSWIETNWGGHAIVALDLSDWTQTVEATFVDVPRGQDLKARVILDVDQTQVQAHLVNGTDPISQSLDSQTSDIWVVISIDELNTNSLNIPIRPKTLIQVTDFEPWNQMNGLVYNEDYMYGTYQISKSSNVNQTTFVAINPDITNIPFKDIAYFCNSYNDDDFITETWVTSLLYKNDGALIVSDFNYTVYPISLADNTDPGIFLGATLYVDASTEMSWGVTYGVLYDNSPLLSTSNISWTTPSGFSTGDLIFRVLHITNTNLVENDIETVDKIFNSGFTMDVDQGNITANNYTNVLLDDQWDGSWIIVLAKAPGGEEFIYCTYWLLG